MSPYPFLLYGFLTLSLHDLLLRNSQTQPQYDEPDDGYHDIHDVTSFSAHKNR
jgi:hypothetical protein